MSDLFSTPNLRDERVVIDDPDALDIRPLAGVGGKHDLKMIRMKAVTSENPFHSHFSDSALKRLKALMANDALEWANNQAVADALLLNAVKAAEGLDRHWSYIYELAALVRDSELFRTSAEGSGFASSPAETFDAWWETNMQAPFAKFKEFEQTYHLAARFGISVEGKTEDQAKDEIKTARAGVVATSNWAGGEALREERGLGHGGDRRSESFKVDTINLEKQTGTNALRLYREVKQAAAAGDALAQELLEKLDRKEIKPAAAARQLGLRRPQITVPLRPDLDARLRKVVEAEETTIREVTEMALERFLDWLEQAEEAEGEEPVPEPEPRPEPARQDPPPTPAGEQSAERPQLGDLIVGNQIGPLLGKSLAHASNAIKRAQEKGKPVATIQQDGWTLVRELAAEDKRWRVIEVPA